MQHRKRGGNLKRNDPFSEPIYKPEYHKSSQSTLKVKKDKRQQKQECFEMSYQEEDFKTNCPPSSSPNH